MFVSFIPNTWHLWHLSDYLANRVTNHPSPPRESAHLTLEAQCLGPPKWLRSLKEKQNLGSKEMYSFLTLGKKKNLETMKILNFALNING